MSHFVFGHRPGVCWLWIVTVACWGSATSVEGGMLYGSFPNTTSLTLKGRATLVLPSRLRVANNAGPLAPGSAFFNHQVNVADGFTTQFRFQLHSPGGGGLGDGLAFVIQNTAAGPQAIGFGGSGLGYSTLFNSLAVELDILGDLPGEGPHIAVHSGGTQQNFDASFRRIGGIVATPSLVDLQEHVLRIDYQSGALSVYLDDAFVLTRNVNLATLLSLDQGKAYVGFTAGVATNNANLDVLNWRLDNNEPLQVIVPPAAVPEPGVGLLGLGGLAGLWVTRRQTRQKAAARPTGKTVRD